MPFFDIVVAVDLELGIGRKGALPWQLPGDMKHFKELTTQTKTSSKKNAVMMGRKTWESLPKKFQPLPDRINLVLSRNKNLVVPEGVLKAENFDEALSACHVYHLKDVVEKIFVIGGAEIFKEAVRHPHCRKIYLTQILAKFDCDAFFPAFKHLFKQTSVSPPLVERGIEYYFAQYIPA